MQQGHDTIFEVNSLYMFTKQALCMTRSHDLVNHQNSCGTEQMPEMKRACQKYKSGKV